MLNVAKSHLLLTIAVFFFNLHILTNFHPLLKAVLEKINGYNLPKENHR